MRICAVSDLHGRLPEIPPCDVLVIAGDICPDSTSTRLIHLCDPDLMRVDQMGWLQTDFEEWLRKLPPSVRIVIATPGNHDFWTRLPESVASGDGHPPVHLLIDEGLEAYGKKFYASPWVNPCGPWNYQMDRARRKVAFSDIPAGLDLLITHSPAYLVGDRTYSAKLFHGKPGEPIGCEELRREIYDKKPRFHVFGHIHEGRRYGHIYTLGSTTSFNVAMWGLDWQPTTFEL